MSRVEVLSGPERRRRWRAERKRSILAEAFAPSASADDDRLRASNADLEKKLAEALEQQAAASEVLVFCR
jgi:hypothetical protein